MKEEFKYIMIKKLVGTIGNKNTVALKLACSQQMISSMIIAAFS